LAYSDQRAAPSGDALLVEVRAALGGDLDTTTAWRWSTSGRRPTHDGTAPALVREAVEAQLGVQL